MDFENIDLFFKINLQWFAKDGPGGEKTEPATAKKLRDARKEGKVAKSKELTAAFDLIVLFLVLKIFISFLGERLINQFSYIYSRIPDFVKQNADKFKSGAIVIDTCGIKSEICKELTAVSTQNGFIFIGAHPMARKETSGYSSSCSDLFDKNTCYPFESLNIDILLSMNQYMCLYM